MNEPVATPESDPERPECSDAIAALQRFLDGDSDWDEAEAASHRAICLVCREELLLATSIAQLPADVVVPSHLCDRVLDRAVTSRRLRKFGRFAAGASALAACLLIAVVAFRKDDAPGSGPGPVAVAPKPDPVPVAKVEPKKPLGESMNEARDAIVSLTKRTASETKDQSARKIPETKMPAAKDPSDGFEPLADVRTGAARSVQPVRSSAKRAFNLFLRAADPPNRAE